MRGVYYQVSNALSFLHLNSQSTLLAAHLHDLRTSSKLNKSIWELLRVGLLTRLQWFHYVSGI